MTQFVRPPGESKSRGYTQDLFNMAEDQAAMFDPHHGSEEFDDFLCGAATGLFTKTNLNSATATFTQLAGRHGIMRLDPGSTTDNHGGQVQFGAGSLVLSSNSVVAFEKLVRLSTVSTEPQALIGIAEADTSLLDASGAIAVDDFIGFVMTGDDLNLDFHVRVGGSSQIKASVGTVVDGAWLHLGVRIDNGKVFTPFVNQLRVDDAIITGASYAPTEELAPSIALVGAGTVQPTLDIDWRKSVDTYSENIR